MMKTSRVRRLRLPRRLSSANAKNRSFVAKRRRNRKEDAKRKKDRESRRRKLRGSDRSRMSMSA